jgi:membrane-associated phospholipid phosphatase
MDNSSSLKFFLYDWAGYNKAISESIHASVSSKFLIAFFRCITQIGNFYLFPIVLGLLLISFFIILKNNKKDALKQGISYTKCLSILFLNLVAAALIVEFMKNFFHYTRPYCFYGFDMSKYMLYSFSYPADSCNHSFPSAHATYICLLVASFWNILNKKLKTAGILLVLLVGASRVILGKHFIADVAYGYGLALLIINPLGNLLATKYFPCLEPIARKLLKKIVY